MRCRDKQKKITKKQLTLISRDDLEKVLSEIANTAYDIPCQIAIHTGLRCGEVLGLTWDDIDFDTKTITVNKQLQNQHNDLVIASTKTTTSNRVLGMTKKLYDILLESKTQQAKFKSILSNEYHTKHDFVCCHDDGRPINPRTLTNYTARLVDKLGISFKFHDLRHLHATMMLEADANIKVLQERLGHSDIGTTLNTYSHVTRKLEDAAIERF